MLICEHVSKSYRGKRALEDVSLSLPRGELVGLFGENGAGKTTLLKSILGLICHEGTVTLDGAPIDRRNIEKLSFATCEHTFFPRLTAEAHRDFYAEHFTTFRDDRFRALMEFFDLPRGTRIGSFSTGQKNQFEVVLALSQGADYVLMDEPFSGNDVFNREDFYKVLLGILEPHETVLLSTHLIDEVAPSIGRALLLHRGRIVADKSTMELEEEGTDLMSFVKSVYRYKADRVLETLHKLDGEETR